MSRRALNVAIIFGGVALLVVVPWVLPAQAVFVLAGIGWGVGVAGYLARGRYGAALSLMKKQQWEAAFDELLAFEKQVSVEGWRRRLAPLATGFSTFDPVALAKATQGAVRLEQGRLAEAELLLEAAVALDPEYSLAWANRALAAAGLGDLEKARLHAERARALGVRSASFEAAMARGSAARAKE